KPLFLPPFAAPPIALLPPFAAPPPIALPPSPPIARSPFVLAWLASLSLRCAGYNPLEKREVCKGGREVSKKSAHSQPSNKGGSTAQRPPSSHARRNDVSSTGNPANQAAKVTRPSPAAAASPTYDEQITGLKLSIDSLEKERDFYFAKLRDIEILCQTPGIEHSPVFAAIQKILYATDDNGNELAEAQAMISGCLQEPEPLSPIAEVSEEKSSSETHKRKIITNPEFDAAGSANLSPRQRLCDVSDLHHSGSPLMTC
uniref:Microtubule-associated protein RP/EB family member 1C-like n=2 Tax=Cicer arietinum TaxID=3827 RepID=A0A1S2YDF5_CICAR